MEYRIWLSLSDSALQQNAAAVGVREHGSAQILWAAFENFILLLKEVGNVLHLVKDRIIG